jgi:hypothetical protein
MAQANLAAKVRNWLHGNRLGIAGDVQSGPTCLVLDGKVVGSTREPIVTVVTGKNGAGAITLTGAKVGDNVISVVNLSTPADASASFEDTITVADQIQQSSASDLSAVKYLVTLQPQS